MSSITIVNNNIQIDQFARYFLQPYIEYINDGRKDFIIKTRDGKHLKCAQFPDYFTMDMWNHIPFRFIISRDQLYIPIYFKIHVDAGVIIFICIGHEKNFDEFEIYEFALPFGMEHHDSCSSHVKKEFDNDPIRFNKIEDKPLIVKWLIHQHRMKRINILAHYNYDIEENYFTQLKKQKND